MAKKRNQINYETKNIAFISLIKNPNQKILLLT